MQSRTKRLTSCALMCTLMIVSTLWLKFTIPGTDMLVTTQVFFVLLCGQLLPARDCLYAIGTYLLLGLIGLPVFSATAGLGVVLTPSFGYLLGFPVAACVTSAITHRSGGMLGRSLGSFAGVLVIYLIALPYIAALKGLYLNAPMDIGALLAAYCFAFLPLDAAKAVLAAWLGRRLQKPLGLTAAGAARSSDASAKADPR